MQLHHSSRGRLWLTAVATPLLVAGLTVPSGAVADSTSGRPPVRLVAVDDNGVQAPAGSHGSGATPVSSADGRYVVFDTESALVSEDDNGTTDVYLRDTVERRTTLVSVTAKGTQGNDYSFEPSISADGRYVAFTTWSTTLIRGGDDNGAELDVLVKDTETGKLRLVSRRTNGAQVARNSFSPVLSANGRYVAFQSFGRFNRSDDDRREDIYLHDLATRGTQQVSLDSRERDLPAHYLVGGISRNGRYVTFGDDNNAWLRDVRRHRSTRLWHEPNDPAFGGGTVGRPVISGNGRFVAFSTANEFVVGRDHGHHSDIFRLNLETGRFKMVSLDSDGGLADSDSFIASLSHTGRYVGFSSFAGDLTAQDTAGSNTYRRDMRTGRTLLTSVGRNGPGNSDSGRSSVSISADGQHMVYESYADNLVASDTNHNRDVFLWGRVG